MVFVGRHTDLPAETTVAHNDGSVTVDPRHWGVWPRDAAEQTPALLAAACTVLSQAAWDDYHELVEPVLCMLEVKQVAFGAFWVVSHGVM